MLFLPKKSKYYTQPLFYTCLFLPFCFNAPQQFIHFLIFALEFLV